MYKINGPKVLGVIPARYGSTRLPEKLLKEINGKSVLHRVFLQCCKATSIDRVVIATDHPLIFEHATTFGAEVLMSKREHSSGTDRVAELSESHPEYSHIINVQGDEPFINPNSINLLVQLLIKKNCDIVTLAVKMNDFSTIQNSHIVKLVTDNENRALYFSRAAIPFQNNANRNTNEEISWNKHVGIYGFKRDALLKVTSLPQSKLERIEMLEQLRWLENGYKIHIGFVDDHPKGIDTMEDLQNAIQYASANNL